MNRAPGPQWAHGTEARGDMKQNSFYIRCEAGSHSRSKKDKSYLPLMGAEVEGEMQGLEKNTGASSGSMSHQELLLPSPCL